MFGLTQEKREEKIKRLNKIASWADSYGTYHNVMIPALEAKEMAEAYIASLTAEPIYQEKRFLDSRGEFIEYWADVNKSTYGYTHESQRRALFTAPPVPEIKLPEKLDVGEIHYELTEKYGLDVSIDQLERGLADEVYSVAVNNFKLLNGLGE